MIHGVIAESTTGAGLPVDIDIRGAEVRIVSGDDEWGADAHDVSIEWLTPDSFRLVFAGEEYLFRPDDPLRARFALSKELAMASTARSRLGFRRRPPEPATNPDTAESFRRHVWVDEHVEIEAITPIDEPLLFDPPPPAPAPTPLHTALIDPDPSPRTGVEFGFSAATPEALRDDTRPIPASYDRHTTDASGLHHVDHHSEPGRPENITSPRHRRTDPRRGRRAAVHAPRVGRRLSAQRGGGDAITRVITAFSATIGTVWVAIESWSARTARMAATGAGTAWRTTQSVFGRMAITTARAARIARTRVRSSLNSLSRAASRLMRLGGTGVRRGLGRAAGWAGGSAAQLIATLRKEPGTRGPAATPPCTDGHSWTGTHHGAFAVERCSRCATVRLSSRDDDAETGITVRPRVTRRTFLLDATAVEALERANGLDDPLI